MGEVEALGIGALGREELRAGGNDGRGVGQGVEWVAGDLFGGTSSSTIWLTKEEFAPFSNSRRTR